MSEVEARLAELQRELVIARQAAQEQEQLAQRQQTELAALQQRAVAATSERAELGVYRITPTIPSFTPLDPVLWFAQIEDQFSLCGIITEVIKYINASSNLDARYASEVSEILRAPPSENPYTFLKEALIRRFTMSDEKRIRQLLSEEQLGDRSPSQFLRHLRSLIGATPIDDGLLKSLWLQRLPINIRAIVQSQPSSNTLDDLATTADKIAEVYESAPASFVHAAAAPVTPAAVPTAPSTAHAAVSAIAPTTDLITKMADMFTLLSETVKALKALKLQNTGRNQNQSRHRSRSRTRDLTPATSSSAPRVCWYHAKYQNDAHKCTSPCDFSAQGNGPSSS